MIITLKTDTKEIKFDILNATRSVVNSRLHTVAQDIKADIEKVIESLLVNSPEYKSLLGGQLMAEFGIANPEIPLRDILLSLRDSVETSITPLSTIGESLRGGINIVILKNGIQNLLALSSVTYQGNKFAVPWLEWLLTQGDRIIVAGYHINYTSPAKNQSSRTGVAIMEKGGGWRVPPIFSGTESDNWISRTFNLSAIKGQIDLIVRKNMQRGF